VSKNDVTVQVFFGDKYGFPRILQKTELTIGRDSAKITFIQSALKRLSDKPRNRRVND